MTYVIRSYQPVHNAKVAILGTGNLALAFAGDIALRLQGAYETVVWAPVLNRRNFDEVLSLQSLQLIASTNGGSFMPNLETDLEAAVTGANFIVLTVPTLGQEGILHQLQILDLSKAILVALPGSATSLTANRILTPRLAPAAVIESTTSPYACRRIGAKVYMLGLKTTFEVATTARLNARVKRSFEALFPNPLQWYPDTASIFLSNINPVAHPPGILAARETIEKGLRPLPKFYRVFVPHAIERAIAIDNERLSIVAALGLITETDFGYSKKWYGGEATESKEFYETYEGYAEVETPTTMQHRYLTEDVKHIMVLWVEIANVFNVDAPEMKNVIMEASQVLGENLFESGRTLVSLGLGNAGPQAIVNALKGN